MFTRGRIAVSWRAVSRPRVKIFAGLALVLVLRPAGASADVLPPSPGEPGYEEWRTSGQPADDDARGSPCAAWEVGAGMTGLLLLLGGLCSLRGRRPVASST